MLWEAVCLKLGSNTGYEIEKALSEDNNVLSYRDGVMSGGDFPALSSSVFLRISTMLYSYKWEKNIAFKKILTLHVL